MSPSTRQLSRLLERRKNTLDFVRFVAATLVIVSHAFTLSQGVGHERFEPFVRLTKGQAGFGGFGVAIFFIISGFLVTASFERSSHWTRYLKARFLRLYPALLVLIPLTIFVRGPLVTTLPLGKYLASPDTYGYLRVLSLYKTSYFLPGVFEANAFPFAVNGALWTLFFELIFYMMILVLGVTRLLRRWVVLAMFVANFVVRAAILVIYPRLGIEHPFLDGALNFYQRLDIYQGTLLLMFYSAGMLLYLYRDRIPLNNRGALLTLPILVLSLISGVGFNYWLATFGAYLLFYLATRQVRSLLQFGKYGDFSYGMYIFAFPVQQTLIHLFGGEMVPMINMAMAIPITLVFAAASWHFIEKPSLRLKNRPLLRLFWPRESPTHIVK